ncbi:MAG: hypothetical protein ABR521_12275 [Gaiellaceae bacterium]
MLTAGGLAWNDGEWETGLALRRVRAGKPLLVERNAEIKAGSRQALVAWRNGLVVGPAGGPLSRLPDADCGLDPRHVVDARGSLVAVGCESVGPRILVLDVLTGVQEVVDTSVIGPDCCTAVQVAGRFLAWAEWGHHNRLTVYDRVSKRVRYRAAPNAGEFDLQEDGKVVVARTRPRDPRFQQLEWYSPAEPRPHLLAVALSRGYRGHVRLANDRIVAVAARGREGYRGDLVVVGLDGSRRTLARFGSYHEREQLAGFDYDGGRIAWGAVSLLMRRVCERKGHGCFTVDGGAWRIWVRDVSENAKAQIVVRGTFRTRK